MAAVALLVSSVSSSCQTDRITVAGFCGRPSYYHGDGDQSKTPFLGAAVGNLVIRREPQMMMMMTREALCVTSTATSALVVGNKSDQNLVRLSL